MSAYVIFDVEIRDAARYQDFELMDVGDIAKMLDAVVDRRQLRDFLINVLNFTGSSK